MVVSIFWGVCVNSQYTLLSTIVFFSFVSFLPSMLACTHPSEITGDSGGPLIVKGTAATGAQDELVGLVSWGISCADDEYPGR